MVFFYVSRMKFNEICRLCLCSDGILLPLNDNSENLLKKIHTISTKVEVDIGDGLPAQVCQQCVKLVNLCYNFKLQVEKSDMTLKNYVNNSQESNNICDIDDEDEKPYVDWELLCDSMQIEVGDISIETNESSSSSQKVEEIPVKNAHTSTNITNRHSSRIQPAVKVMSKQIKKQIVKQPELKDQLSDSCGEKINSFEIFNNGDVELGRESNQVMRENVVVPKETVNKTMTSLNIQKSIYFKTSKTLKTLSNISTAIRRRRYRDCDVCGKSVQNLVLHMKMHTGEKPHQCTVCGHRFIQKGNLQKHLLAHTGERPYNCVECGKTYICISDLNQHRKLHIGTAFTCTICEKGFTSRQNLESHERVHTGEKPYLCQTCGMCFALKGSLTKHSRRVHANDLTHYCSVCNKRFINQSSLNKHFRTHTGEKPYTCDICHNSFADRSYFMRHLGVHSGEKSFGCFVCSKRFTQQISLKRHIRLHTGEKPFHCTLCEERFVLKRDLKKHTERLHSAGIQ